MPSVRVGFSVASHSGPKMASKDLAVLLQVHLLLEAGPLQHVCECRAQPVHMYMCVLI